MSNRTLRVNELIQRELNAILHSRYQSEAVAITITEVRVAPDIRDARLFVSILGKDDFVEQKLRWLRAKLPEIRIELGTRIVLKYMPRFTVAIDTSTTRGNRILQALDEIGLSESAPEQEPTKEDKPQG